MPEDRVRPATRGLLSGAETAARLVFWTGALLFTLYILLKLGQMLLVTGTGVHRVDFFAFWAAAKLALAGEAGAAFDPVALLDAGGYPAEDRPTNLIWLYPPGFLALVAPLGLLPFWLAWCVFILASATALALALRAPAAPLPGGWRLPLVAPALLVGALYLGQTSALWAAGLAGALWALRRGRPAAAGLLIALLTLKPQLGLLIPFALIAGGHWRAIGWAIVCTVLVLAGSTLLFGAEYWPAFLDALREATRRVAAGEMPIMRLVSPYGFAREAGAGHGPALLVQGVATILLIVATVWAWSRHRLGPDLKAAVLCAAIPLATPYAFHYEMLLTLVAALFLYRDGFGRTPTGMVCLFLAWLGPLPGFYLPAPDSVALVGPPLAALILTIALARAWRRHRQAPGPAVAPGEPAEERHVRSP